MTRKRTQEHLVTTGNVDVKSRGGQIIKIIDGLAAWIGKNLDDGVD